MAKHWMACEVEEVKLLALGEAILFMGCGTPTIGLTHNEASRCRRAIPIMDHWAGRTVVVAGRPVPWREVLKWNWMKGMNWLAGLIDKNGCLRRRNPPRSEGWRKRMLQPERTLIWKRGSSPSAGGAVESPEAPQPAKKRHCTYCRQTDHTVEDCKQLRKKRIALNSKGETKMEGTAPPYWQTLMEIREALTEICRDRRYSLLLDNRELGPFRSSKDSPKVRFLRDSCEHPITLNNNVCCEVRDFSIDDLTHNVAVWYNRAILEESAGTPDHLVETFETGAMPVRTGMDPLLTEGSMSYTAGMTDPQHTYARATDDDSPLFVSTNFPNTACSSTNDNYVKYTEMKGRSRSMPLNLDLTPGDLVLLQTDGRRGKKRIGKR